MKKIFFLPILASFALGFFSCDEDESLSPIPPKDKGTFMVLDITQKQMLFSDLDNTYFGGKLIDMSGGRIVKYELMVRMTNSEGIVMGNYVPYEAFTSFPADLRVTPQKLAAAIGIPVSDLRAGDVFRFLGYAYDANGKKTSYLDLSRSVQIAGFVEQAFRFNTSLTNAFAEDYNNRDLQI